MSANPRRQESGFLTVEFMAAVAFSLIFLVMMVNFIVIEYGRGVVRGAVDEAARTGSRIQTDPAAATACQQRGLSVTHDLLGGRLGKGLEFTCTAGPTRMQATATITFQPWIPGVPDLTEVATAIATRERPPVL